MRTQSPYDVAQDVPPPTTEPTQTGPRALLGVQVAGRRTPSGTRVSTRPSAFGLPPTGTRAKLPTKPEPAGQPAAPASASATLEPSEPSAELESSAQAQDRAAGTSTAGPTHALTSSTPHARTEQPASAIKTDIEELLPLSQAVKSLPRPPRLPMPDVPAAAPSTRRFPWVSLAVFALMLAASSAPLMRYSGVRTSAKPHVASVPPAPATRAPGSLAASLPSSHAVAQLRTLLDEGERALANADERLAEARFGRAYELDPNHAGAHYGLARVRFAQGDLEGAEGWLLSAIAKRPREAAYRLLNAELLERRGRRDEAERERALARSFAP